MICIDALSTFCSIAPQTDWTRSKQVWVAGYEAQWND